MPSDIPARVPLPIAMPDNAFGAALIEQAASLSAYARRLTGGGADADDLLQDTMLRCWTARASFAAGTSLAAWTRTVMAQSARSCDFGHLGEHVGNGLVVVDDRPCEERRSAPIRERRYEPWRFEWGSDRLLEPEFFGHRVRDRQSGDGTTGIGGSA